MTQKFDFLSIEVDAKDGKLEGRATGRLGDLPPVKAQVDRFFKVMNGLKVIATKNGMNVYNLYNPPQPSNAGMSYLVRSVRQMVFNQVFPATANFAITYRCQCRCVHCSADPSVNPGRTELTTDELKANVSVAQDLGTSIVIFTGGEPLLHKDLFDLIRHVDKDRSISMIFTNGNFLTPENCARLAEAGLFSLNVSIDSFRAEVHDEARKVPGLYEKAWRGIKEARKAGILAGVSTYAS